MKIKITPVFDQDYLPTLLEQLSRAQHQIDILSFSFAIGSAAGKHNTKTAPYQIAKKIKELKKQLGKKLKIRFFTEGLRDTVDRNKVTALYLQEAGVEVRFGSTHAKGFCIDGKTVLFGSTNLTHQSLMKNFEANVLVEDKKCAFEFTRYFEHLWEGGKHGEIDLRPPLLADGSFKDVLLHSINHAKKEIQFAIYFFNHREIENALIAAFERGIKIKGLIHEHLAFAMPYIRANRQTVKRLKQAGIIELYFGPTSLFSHSKYLVIDQKEFYLGTGNWLVEDVLIHPQLFIHLQDAKVAKSLIQHLSLQIAGVV
jgi:phosphatidylserine/phosphatidylglycerophosphate/cardiolipin synthase-like enzyme